MEELVPVPAARNTSMSSVECPVTFLSKLCEKSRRRPQRRRDNIEITRVDLVFDLSGSTREEVTPIFLRRIVEVSRRATRRPLHGE